MVRSVRWRSIGGTVGLAGVLAAVGGCGLGLGPSDPSLADLDRAQAKWERTRPSTYRYAVRRSCFCPVEYTGPARLTVSGEQIVARVYVESGDTVPEMYADAYPTVGGLFDLLRSAIEAGADHVTVSYDDETGVPTELWIDYHERVADEEVGFTVVEPVQAVPAG